MYVFVRVLMCVHVCACVPCKQTWKGSKPALTQLDSGPSAGLWGPRPFAQNSAFSITETQRLKTLCVQIKTVTFPAADNAESGLPPLAV